MSVRPMWSRSRTATIVWSPNSGPGFGTGDNINAYTGFDLSTQTTIASLPAAVTPTDPHELTPLPNGDRMMISTPLVTKDLSALGNGSGETPHRMRTTRPSTAWSRR